VLSSGHPQSTGFLINSFRDGFMVKTQTRIRLTGFIVVALLTSQSCLAADADEPKIPDLNRAILQFCADNLGKKVGDGECATLALRGCDKAGAKRPSDLPKPKPPLMNDDYVWGRLLEPKEEVLPGDIIQFRDVEIKVVSPRLTYSYTYPHHTAIVAEVKGKQKFTIYQQNIGGPDKTEEQTRTVQKAPLDLGAKVKGTVWIYRPLAK
jgi:hypothetical protein